MFEIHDLDVKLRFPAARPVVQTIMLPQANQISLKSNFEGTLVLMFLLMSAFTEQKMEQMMHHKSTLS